MLNPIKKKLNILAKILPFTKFLGHEVTIIAHRGNSSEAPENTLAAFKSAAKDNIPYIECDIHLTKDAVPVVFHDRCVSRTTNHHIPMPIDHLTLSEVKSLDCGFWFHSSFAGEKIPTLKEVLEAPLGNIGLMVEIKEGSAPDSILVAATLRVIHQYMNKGNSRPIIIGSKSPNIVKLVKDNTSQLKQRII
jgi:glycerophosphoryl diester phosphodiesterase